MSEVITIEQIKEMATPIIEIPNFDNTGTIKVRVKKPNLVNMAANGKIPNYLMSIAAAEMGIRKREEKPVDELINDVAKTMELYCRACLVEPTYDEFKEYMTDEQMEAIFDWAMGDIKKVEPFRDDKGNGEPDNDGEGVSKKTK